LAMSLSIKQRQQGIEIIDNLDSSSVFVFYAEVSDLIDLLNFHLNSHYVKSGSTAPHIPELLDQ